MSQRFAGQVAVITGGASGIGWSTARLLVAEGAKVVVGDLNPDAAQKVASELGTEHAAYCRCDVAVFAEVEAMMALAVDRFGSVDILVNNAGIGSDICTAVELSLETWRRVVAVDLDSVFHGCKAAIPLMRESGGGAIVNVASISGLGGDYGFNAYNAAKGAVINFTRALALDHARDNVRVNAVCPGLIDTALTAFIEKRGYLPALTQNIPMKRIGRPEEIAKLIGFLASADASYMTGSIVVADGGLTAGTGNPDLGELVAQSAAQRNAGREAQRSQPS